ncbi:MAG: TRAP transporter small permease subunit [Clostridiales Family XIII bacterium]|jgi:TRAP-type C4-dicarboxylate transport system permease small subunit|nr:TRAP transporter small permease subunit [Clostridiales Family XIII bacterium]
MKKLLRIADKAVFYLVDYISAAMTFLIFAIVTMVVLFRFVFQSSSFGFEELPTYFLMIAIWLGAVICSRDPKEGQIKIDLLVNAIGRRPRVKSAVNMVASLFSISCIGLYTWLSLEYVVFTYEAGQATFALKVPIWILTGLAFFACLLLTVYEIVILIKEVNHFRSLGSAQAGRVEDAGRAVE